MIRQTSFHLWRDSQRLVNSAVVLVHEVERDPMRVVLKLLAEAVRYARETAHLHPHRKVLTLYISGEDVLRIGIPAQDSGTASPSS